MKLGSAVCSKIAVKQANVKFNVVVMWLYSELQKLKMWVK